MEIAVCCPSYKRPKVETFDYIPFCKCYVAQKEYDSYIEANKGFEKNIIPVPDEIQGNLCRIRNYIMKKELDENKNDVLVIIDDDMKGVYYFEGNKKKIKVESKDFLYFIEKHTILAKDIGAYFWGININGDSQSYREYSPFSTRSYIGGPFQCFLKGNELFYDERLPLKEDYDMTLQQLNKYRVVLRMNKFHYDVKQSEQAGGCANYRNFKREKEQLDLLIKKWGSKIVKIDTSDKSHKSDKKKVKLDYNPIIKVPIKGI